MRQGKAPIGLDGKKVQLHHLEGISKNIDGFIEIGADAHKTFHSAFGYKDFINLAVFWRSDELFLRERRFLL